MKPLTAAKITTFLLRKSGAMLSSETFSQPALRKKAILVSCSDHDSNMKTELPAAFHMYEQVLSTISSLRHYITLLAKELSKSGIPTNLSDTCFLKDACPRVACTFKYCAGSTSFYYIQCKR